MDFEQLRQAVREPLRQKDYAGFRAVLDEFLKAAKNEDYGRGLNLHAEWFLLVDVKHVVQGFLLVDEALPFLAKTPGAKQSALTTALGLCYTCNDVERARAYEEEACRLLLEHATDPSVRNMRHRLQHNLGLVAYCRADYATAYWYFAQAANSLSSAEVPEAERRSVETSSQIGIAMACLRVRRFYEAQEALDLAEQVANTEFNRFRIAVWRSELLRQLGQIEEAVALLSSLSGSIEVSNSPDLRGRYFWISALLAQDAGDLPRFHHYLNRALAEAAEHRYDYLLSEIQRFQRSPLS